MCRVFHKINISLLAIDSKSKIIYNIYNTVYEREKSMGMEWIIAIAVAVLAIIVVALLLIRRSRLSVATIDTIVGEKCVVTERIDNFAGCGQVRVKGQLWSARGFYDDDVYESGASLRIVAIEGVKAVCKKD